MSLISTGGAYSRGGQFQYVVKSFDVWFHKIKYFNQQHQKACTLTLYFCNKSFTKGCNIWKRTYFAIIGNWQNVKVRPVHRLIMAPLLQHLFFFFCMDIKKEIGRLWNLAIKWWQSADCSTCDVGRTGPASLWCIAWLTVTCLPLSLKKILLEECSKVLWHVMIVGSIYLVF